MAGLIKAASTTRGNPAVRDSNMFLYVSNGAGTGTLRWRCSKDPGNLVGKKHPEHSHGNKLIQKIAKDSRTLQKHRS